MAAALGLPRLWLSQGLGTEPGSAGPGVRGLSAEDFGDGGNQPAAQPPSAEDLIPCCPPSCQPFQWHVGAPASGAARAGQLQDRLAPALHAAPGDGRSRPQPVADAGRDRRDGDSVPLETRSGGRQEGRALPGGQELDRRRGGTFRAGRAPPHPSGADPRRLVERGKTSSPGQLRPAPISSATAGWATITRPRTAMRHARRNGPQGA